MACLQDHVLGQREAYTLHGAAFDLTAITGRIENRPSGDMLLKIENADFAGGPIDSDPGYGYAGGENEASSVAKRRTLGAATRPTVSASNGAWSATI
jgi:hypothetical protein